MTYNDVAAIRASLVKISELLEQILAVQKRQLGTLGRLEDEVEDSKERAALRHLSERLP